MSRLARKYHQTVSMDTLQWNIITCSEFRIRPAGSGFAERPSSFYRNIQPKLPWMDSDRTSRLLFFDGDCSTLRYIGTRIVFFHYKPRYVDSLIFVYNLFLIISLLSLIKFLQYLRRTLTFVNVCTVTPIYFGIRVA